MAILTGTYPGNGTYAQIDDPINLPAFFTTGTMNPFPGCQFAAKPARGLRVRITHF
jgi:hypothetical protein